MSKLTIKIEPHQHCQIKTLATAAAMTIKEFILAETISFKTPEHLVFETTEDLKRALGDWSAMEWFGAK